MGPEGLKGLGAGGVFPTETAEGRIPPFYRDTRVPPRSRRGSRALIGSGRRGRTSAGVSGSVSYRPRSAVNPAMVSHGPSYAGSRCSRSSATHSLSTQDFFRNGERAGAKVLDTLPSQSEVQEGGGKSRQQGL